jgi:hypothetical protein
MHKNISKFLRRLLFFTFLFVIHYLFMFLPILEFFVMYIIFFKPKWFEDF